MLLKAVPPALIDKAWRQGASKLGEACDTSDGDITGDQLKMILSRGERTLLAMTRGESVDGWGVVTVDQLPNIRVLFVSAMYAPGARFQEFFEQLRLYADANGCSEIRCAADAVRARLYQIKCGFKPMRTILKVDV
jgi:hypothetical protein